MKKSLLLAAAALLTAAFLQAETNEVLRIDFEQSEGYTVGDALGQNGWTRYNDTKTNTKLEVVNKDTFPIVSGDQCLLVSVKDKAASEDNSQAYVDFDISAIDVEKNYVQFECYVKPSEPGTGSYAARFQINDHNNVMLASCLVFNKGFWSSTYSLKTAANAWAFNPDSPQGGPEKVQGFPDFSVFTKVCWTWDLSKKQLLSTQYGDETCYYTNRWDPETGDEYTPNANIPYGINPSFDGLPSRLVVIGYRDRPEWGLDSFVVRTISKPQTSNPGKLSCSTKSILADTKKNSLAFGITNEGDEPFDFTVTSNSEWIVPATTNGTCAGAANIAINLDRSKLEKGVYGRGIVTVDGGTAGSCEVRVSAQNDGVYFVEDFESPYMVYGDIVALQDRWDNNMTPPSTYFIAVTNAYEREGVGYAQQTAWYDGQLVSVDTINDEILHVGLDMYIPSSTETTQFEVKSGYWAHAWNLTLQYQNGAGTFGVKSVNGNTLLLEDWQLPMDEWVRLDMVIDYQAQRLVSVALGDYTANVDLELMLDTNGQEVHNLADLSLYATPQENFAGIGLDNIVVERQERTGGPALVAPAVLQAGSDETMDLVLRNSGTGSFNYEVKALDNTDLFSFEPATGAVEASSTVLMTIKRGEAVPGFYRSRIQTSAGEAGCSTTVVTFACGGYYYACNFEEPWFTDGSIRGQETWTYDPDQPVANFDNYVSNGVLVANAAPGYTGMRADIKAPTNNFMTVKTWIYASSENPNGSRLYFKQNSAWPYAEFLITQDNDNQCLKLTKSDIDESEFVMYANLDEWIPFAYTMWFPDESISEITFGDETVKPEAIYMSNMNNKFSKIIMCVSDKAGFLVDNISVYDPEVVPEPALLALAALLGALALRRR